MKRSEMNKLIFDHLIKFVPDTYAANICAETLLDKIEEAGMLPPYVNDRVEHHCRKIDVCFCHNKWEPEDGQ